VIVPAGWQQNVGPDDFRTSDGEMAGGATR